MIQALGGLSKTPIAHQPKGGISNSPFLLSPINGLIMVVQFHQMGFIA